MENICSGNLQEMSRHDDERGTASKYQRMGTQLTDLALDLFASPSSGIASTAAEILVRTSLPRHRCKEVVAEVFPYFAILEGICQVPIRN